MVGAGWSRSWGRGDEHSVLREPLAARCPTSELGLKATTCSGPVLRVGCGGLVSCLCDSLSERQPPGESGPFRDVLLLSSPVPRPWARGGQGRGDVA